MAKCKSSTPQLDIREEQTIDNEVDNNLSPPPLPPRQHTLKKDLSEQQSTSINNSQQTTYNPPILPSSPIPCSPPKTPTNLASSSEETTPFNRSQYSQLSPTHQYQQLSRLSGDFGIQKTITNSSSKKQPNGVPNKRKELYQTISFSENIFQQNLTQTKRVHLSLGILADNVIFVDWKGKV
uniref:Uncharacterized protein n=1 Tax=Meloidogyne incognita TaxID=6306 RepID=A0A914NR50_MELIC